MKKIYVATGYFCDDHFIIAAGFDCGRVKEVAEKYLNEALNAPRGKRGEPIGYKSIESFFIDEIEETV